jgi:hypothetical protein
MACSAKANKLFQLTSEFHGALSAPNRLKIENSFDIVEHVNAALAEKR